MPISVVPVSFLVGAALLVVFCRTELALERRNANPLFEFSQFRLRTFRLANMATFAMAFAQLGVSIALVLFLQESRHLSPMENGLWFLPSGLATLIGAPFGGWLSRRAGAVVTMRIGSVVNAVGVLLMAWALSSDASYWYVLPAFVVYGFSAGLVASQINRVLLHDIVPAASGAASGINSTARQMATALGVATIGMIFATISKDRGVHAALWPAMGVASVALFASAAVIWRMPRIDSEDHILDEARSEDIVRADALQATLEG
jgi:predicted MFS family arabinose efflux permease